MNLTVQTYQPKVNYNQSFKSTATKAVEGFTDKVAAKLLARVTAGTALATMVMGSIHKAKECKPYYNPEDNCSKKDAADSAAIFKADLDEVVKLVQIEPDPTLKEEEPDIYETTKEFRDEISEKLTKTGRFKPTNIRHIVMYMKPKYVEALDMVLEARNNDKPINLGQFSGVSPEKTDALENILKAHNYGRTYRFDKDPDNLEEYFCETSTIIHGFYICGIKNPIDYLRRLLDATNKEGKFRLNADDIGSIIGSLTEDNIELFEDLFTMKNPDGTYRFDNAADRGHRSDIGEILHAATLYGKDMVKTLMYAKDKGNYRFSPWDIHFIPVIRKDGQLLDEILQQPGNKELDTQDITEVMYCSNNSYNKEKFNELYAIYKSGKPIGRYEQMTLYDIFEEFNPNVNSGWKLSDDEIHTVYSTIPNPERFFKE